MPVHEDGILADAANVYIDQGVLTRTLILFGDTLVHQVCCARAGAPSNYRPRSLVKNTSRPRLSHALIGNSGTLYGLDGIWSDPVQNAMGLLMLLADIEPVIAELIRPKSMGGNGGDALLSSV